MYRSLPILDQYFTLNKIQKEVAEKPVHSVHHFADFDFFTAIQTSYHHLPARSKTVLKNLPAEAIDNSTPALNQEKALDNSEVRAKYMLNNKKLGYAILDDLVNCREPFCDFEISFSEENMNEMRKHRREVHKDMREWDV